MEHILNKSYGIITYQDDVLMIAIELAGYTWLEADKFRKAMGKKIPEEMAAQKEKFLAGCIERGMAPLIAQRLWEQIETFAAYGFNKSHAASYGNLAYKTAYMKANYPLEYMSALLTADSGDIERIAETVKECIAMDITVLPPDINESFEVFTVVTTASVPTIRFGLISIKNFGEGIAHSIVEERKKNGPFASLQDFLMRIEDKNLNKRGLEALIKGGALDTFTDRGTLLTNIERLLQYHKDAHAGESNQTSLFGSESDSTGTPLSLAPGEPVSLTQKLIWEKELLGLYISGNPLDAHTAKITGKPSINDTKTKMYAGISTVIFGLVEDVRSVLTKKGERMAFIRVSDYTDTIESVAFPEVYGKHKDILVPGMCILLKGKITERNGEKSFMIDAVKLL
jgi:DNA polymerase-3 subunit alpha